jgi:hypothetical protein
MGSVALVLVATIGVFTFAKPQYHQACQGCAKPLHFSEAKPPANGWLYSDATPGFHFGEHGNLWRTSRIQAADVPDGAGIFTSLTDAPARTEAIYSSGSCLGVRLRTGARTRLCDPHAAAVMIVDAVPRYQHGWNLFVIGVARSDVTRVTVQARGAMQTVMHGSTRSSRPLPPQVVYDAKTPGWWGSFDDSTFQPVPWDLTVKVFGKHGLIATTRARFSKPGDALYCASALRGVCGMSAQRRS